MFDRTLAKEFLFRLDDALNSVGLPHFLVGGTALGAWRDHDFTPTERDIDIGVLLSLPKMVEYAAVALLRSGIEVTTWDRHMANGLPHTVVAQWRGLHADIVGWRQSPDGRMFAQAPSNVEPHYCIVHEPQIIKAWKRVEMFGRFFNVSSDIEMYLECEYGPDWRTPKDDHVSRTRVYNFLQGVPADER